LADGTLKWSAVRATTVSEADDFGRSFLVGNDGADKDGGVEIRVRAIAHIEAVVTNKELDFLEKERG
jgi:hypothetical protein